MRSFNIFSVMFPPSLAAYTAIPIIPTHSRPESHAPHTLKRISPKRVEAVQAVIPNTERLCGEVVTTLHVPQNRNMNREENRRSLNKAEKVSIDENVERLTEEN
ncbi:hypothetical protein V1514DRAFT_37185 [Lipomyces japonicus]|uniref:uncharacterized protein n=1 Tax=Lipomyces japonicus TaxID=56871 RepID=UPI0034CE66AC